MIDGIDLKKLVNDPDPSPVSAMIYTDIKNGRFYNEDCFNAMREIPDGVIDMVLCDLPYGTTKCKWDAVLPFKELWAEYWRVCKPNAAIVLTASQPFTSALIISQINYFKYEWIWEKDKPSNFALANKQPMKYHENICIFSKIQPIYNKQMQTREGDGKKRYKYAVDNTNRVSEHSDIKEKTIKFYDPDAKNPSSVQYFNTGRRQDIIHPTQKPVALFEYLIKTYTNEGELVLDNTAGSGTTAIAAINTNRKWVCIEKEKEYYDKALDRIINHVVTA